MIDKDQVVEAVKEYLKTPAYENNYAGDPFAFAQLKRNYEELSVSDQQYVKEQYAIILKQAHTPAEQKHMEKVVNDITGGALIGAIGGALGASALSMRTIPAIMSVGVSSFVGSMFGYSKTFKSEESVALRRKNRPYQLLESLLKITGLPNLCEEAQRELAAKHESTTGIRRRRV